MNPRSRVALAGTALLVTVACADSAGGRGGAADPGATTAAHLYGILAASPALAEDPGAARAARAAMRSQRMSPRAIQRIGEHADIRSYAVADDTNVCLYAEKIRASSAGPDWDAIACARLTDARTKDHPILTTVPANPGVAVTLLAPDGVDTVRLRYHGGVRNVGVVSNGALILMPSAPLAMEWHAPDGRPMSMDLVV